MRAETRSVVVGLFVECVLSAAVGAAVYAVARTVSVTAALGALAFVLCFIGVNTLVACASFPDSDEESPPKQPNPLRSSSASQPRYFEN